MSSQISDFWFIPVEVYLSHLYSFSYSISQYLSIHKPKDSLLKIPILGFISILNITVYISERINKPWTKILSML